MSSELVEHRKELIKFAWNHLKSEDTTTRQCAYVLVCRFIEAYETPPKIILQVYVALLRAFQPEARSLVKQALDILTPALQKRLPAGNDVKFPTWVKWTKKIILEEGHSLPQLIHILQLIVRHPQLFYPSRGQFVPHMVNSLARIGLLPNSPNENRKLAVDLAELIINWEKQRVTESEQKDNNNNNSEVNSMEVESTNNNVQSSKAEETMPTSMDLTDDKKETKSSTGGKAPVASDPAATAEFKASSTISEMIVNFLIRIASTSNDASDHSGLPHRALELLKLALTLWPDVYIKFAYFEKLLGPANDQPIIVSTGLGILNVIFDYQLQKLILENIGQMQTALTPSVTCNNPKVLNTQFLIDPDHCRSIHSLE